MFIYWCADIKGPDPGSAAIPGSFARNMCQIGNRLGPRLRMVGEDMLSSEDVLQLDFLEEEFRKITLT